MSTHEIGALVESITGRRPTGRTVRRWITRGVSGERLEAVRCGGSFVINPADVRRFLDRLNGREAGALV